MKPTRYGKFNYDHLLPMIESDDYRRYESPGYLRLVIEKLYYPDCKGRPVYSIAHYDEQNGDLMRDPEITFSFDHESQTVEPQTFQNDYMGHYEEIYENRNGVWLYSKSHRASLDDFLHTWLKNIEHQGYTMAESNIY